MLEWTRLARRTTCCLVPGWLVLGLWAAIWTLPAAVLPGRIAFQPAVSSWPPARRVRWARGWAPPSSVSPPRIPLCLTAGPWAFLSLGTGTHWYLPYTLRPPPAGWSALCPAGHSRPRLLRPSEWVEPLIPFLFCCLCCSGLTPHRPLHQGRCSPTESEPGVRTGPGWWLQVCAGHVGALTRPKVRC